LRDDFGRHVGHLGERRFDAAEPGGGERVLPGGGRGGERQREGEQGEGASHGSDPAGFGGRRARQDIGAGGMVSYSRARRGGSVRDRSFARTTSGRARSRLA